MTTKHNRQKPHIIGDIIRPQEKQRSSVWQAFHSNSFRRSRKLTVVIVILLIIGLAFFIVKYQQARQDIKRLAGSQSEIQNSQQKLVDKIGKIVELPGGENPVVFNISDISKLKDIVFFDKAKNGDQVLIYTQAGEAILYRPSSDKIIRVQTVNLTGNDVTSDVQDSN